MDHKADDFKQIINQISPINSDDFNLIIKNCNHYIFKKGTILLNVGEIDTKVRFIKKGLVKAYRINNSENGENKEKINWFASENKVACSAGSFFTNEASTEYLETIEETELLSISAVDFNQLINTVPTICKLARLWTVQYLLMYDKRMDIFRLPKPAERLKLFKKIHPELMSRLSKKEIASFLDITQSTLSKAFHEL